MNTHDLAEAIAVSLNVEREAAGWTLEDLSKELGLSEQTLGRYLTRRTRSLPVDVLTRACAVMGIPITDVITRAEERMRNASSRDETRETARRIAEEARRLVREGAEQPTPRGEDVRKRRGSV